MNLISNWKEDLQEMLGGKLDWEVKKYSIINSLVDDHGSQIHTVNFKSDLMPRKRGWLTLSWKLGMYTTALFYWLVH